MINSIATDLDAVIINGDLTEEINYYPETISAVENDREILKSEIRTSLNTFSELISKHTNKIVYLRGNHDGQIINSNPIVENYALLESEFGRIVIFHGHQTNLSKYGIRFGWGVEVGRLLKKSIASEHYVGIKLKEEDFIIVGHCHVAYYDRTAMIFSPGCWVGNYENRNVGWYILINDEDFDTPAEGIRLKRINKTYRNICRCGYEYLTNNDLYCPQCKKDVGSKYIKCDRPLRGEELRKCKNCEKKEFNFYE
jgi:predicted phosphodiesterase